MASSGVVVRNTFIDVCPEEEGSNSDDSSPCHSPHRRNVSAPPSPVRKRREDYSDQEEEEEPGAIPSYEWAPDGGLVSASDADKPPWMKPPPGSPKRVGQVLPSKKTKRRDPLVDLYPSSLTENGLPSYGPTFLDDFYGEPAGTSMGGGSLGGFGSGLAGAGSFGSRGFGSGLGHSVGLESHRSGDPSNPGEDIGAAYLSERPPPNSALGSGISTEAPVYILNAACSSDGPQQVPASSMPEAGRRLRGGLDAGQRPPPSQPMADAGGWGKSAPWPTFYHGDHGDQNVHSFQMGHAIGPGGLPPSGGMPMPGAYDMRPMPTGDAGDRRLQNDAAAVLAYNGGFMDPMAYAVHGAHDPYAMSRPMGGCSGSNRAPMYGKGRGHGGYHDSGPGPHLGEKGAGGAAQRAGRGGNRGNRDRPLRDEVMEEDTGKGAPWVAPGAAGKGKGVSGTSDSDGKVTKAPLSGGGPKRTDYIKKYGGVDPEGSTPHKQPITTMMLRNIPCRKSQEEVMAHIDGKGFTDTYDFFYLPRDVKFRANLGYAFINFLTPEDAARFGLEMNGYRFSGSGSSKACAVVPAHVQGLQNNLSAFKRTEVMRSSRKPYFNGVVAL